MSVAVNGLKYKARGRTAGREPSPRGSCSPVPGGVGAELQGLPGRLEARQVAEDRGAHEARARPSERAHLVELEGKGRSYGEASSHRVRRSGAGLPERRCS